MKEYKGRIELIEKIADETYEIKFSSDLKDVKAGQFVSILCDNKTLRRPFSVADFEDNIIKVLFKKRGKGTKYISNLKTGDEIDFLAPLGKPFPIFQKKALLVGAGIGIAPMLFLKKELDKRNIDNFLISGFKKEEEVISGSDETIIGGSVLDKIEETIEKEKIEIIYSCAPKIVLQKLSVIAKERNLESYLAMEKIMACSIGVCRGCVINLMRDNKIINATICKDGPVFKGSEIVWE